MDHKTLKSDLTYVIKKLTKEGKIFTLDCFPQNLQIKNSQFVWEGINFDILEALIYVKGFQYIPIKEVSNWTDPQGTHHRCEWWYHEVFGLPLFDIVSIQGQIAKTDLYDFMDGLENVAGDLKSEFYKVGVYIREKFMPIGIRTDTLQKTKYQEKNVPETARRFIVYNRAIPGVIRKTNFPTILEVECEICISPLSLTDEFTARILNPEWLWEPTRLLQDDVLKDVNMPPVYCSHSIYGTIEQAREAARRQVLNGFDFEVRKGRLTSYSEEELQNKYAEIKEVMLP